jgi:hypothetical protein
MGGRTIPPDIAFNIGMTAKNALDAIQPELLLAYEHENFKEVMEELAAGNVPQRYMIEKALQEFNNGIKFFAGMKDIPVQQLLYIM